MENDIILNFGGKEPGDANELRSFIQNAKPKERVGIIILRDGKRTELTAVLSKAQPQYGYFWDNEFDLNLPQPDFLMPPVQVSEVEKWGEKKDEAYDQLKGEMERLSQEMERLKRELERLKPEEDK